MTAQTREEIEEECARAEAAALAVYGRDLVLRSEVADAECQYRLATARERRKRKLAELEGKG